MTGSAMAAHNGYLTEVQATTEKALVPKRVVQFLEDVSFRLTRNI